MRQDKSQESAKKAGEERGGREELGQVLVLSKVQAVLSSQQGI